MNQPSNPAQNEPLLAIFGLKEDWLHFSQNHQTFLQKEPALLELFGRVFVRTVNTTCLADRVVYFLGRLMLEDFMEILLMCGNGYGVAGLKLLRGLYERAVTVAYIARFPDEADRFLLYHKVHLGKLLNHTAEIYDLKELFSDEKIAEIRGDYEAAKKEFQEPLCKVCKTTRTQISWSRLDVSSMARKADEALAKLYLSCYFMPTLQAHSTVQALFSQMKHSEKEALTFDEGAQRNQVDNALRAAHLVILSALQTQNSYFGLGLEEQIEHRREDWAQSWQGSSEPNATTKL